MNKKQIQAAVAVVAIVACAGLAGKMFLPANLVGGQKAIQVKNENRGHLRVSSLYPSTYVLTSADKNPFDNPLSQKKLEQAKKEKETPKPTHDMIPVTPPAMQREQKKPEPEKKEVSTAGLKLKALASTGDRRVAVIENSGKTTSAFVGSAVGSFIVTNIGDNSVTLQDLNGRTVSLELVS